MSSAIVPSLILLAGVIDDVMTRKVHNTLVIIGIAVGGIYAYFFGGVDQLVLGLLAMVLVLGLYVPLFLFKILGGGDLKIMLAFAISTNWQTVLSVTISAMIWALLLGLVRAALDRKLFSIFKNVWQMISTKNPISPEKLNRIPMTVALFFGWMSHLALNRGQL
ncbi:MAG: prepilin peptidase [Pseudomonadota bacterium]|nr:prepilin peptidase [Pseudomonadota bacterium]